jgi:hypothetical protein
MQPRFPGGKSTPAILAICIDFMPTGFLTLTLLELGILLVDDVDAAFALDDDAIGAPLLD